MEKIRILIVDDHMVFAQALQAILGLQPDLEVVGVVTDGLKAVEDTERTAPHVVIMDYRLPGQSGAEATRAIKARMPQVHVVMLTSFSEEEVLLDSVQAGISGFVSKEKAVDDVVGAVRLAHAGEMRIPAATFHRLLARLEQGRAKDEERLYWVERLTARELEVLRLLAAGADNEAIAERLVISANTVRTHLQNIMQKLQVHSKLQAVTTAVRLGIVPPPQ